MGSQPVGGATEGERRGLIAFVQEGNICLINTDGSEFRRMTSSGKCSEPSWTPDGQRLVFISGGQVWIMKYDGTERRRLTSLKGWNLEHPSVSRDGKKVVFRAHRDTAEGDGLDTLRVMNIDGSNLITVAFERVDVWTAFRGPSFTPDGSAILCVEHGSGTGEACLKLVSLKTGRSRVLYGNGRHKSYYDCYDASYSPDGKRIVARAFCWVAASGAHYPPEGLDGGIVVMNADGSSARLFKGVGYDPTWSADGQKIIAVSQEGLVAFDLRTKEVKVIFSGDAASPACQPMR